MRRPAVAFALVVGLVGVALATGCAQSQNVSKAFKAKKGGSRTFVFFETQPDGSCKATEGVGSLGGKKDTKITWYLSNNCANTQFVTITHYALASDPNNYLNGIVKDDPAYYDNLAYLDQDKKLEAQIIKSNGTSDPVTYKYSICVGASHGALTSCLDPDVDIWP